MTAASMLSGTMLLALILLVVPIVLLGAALFIVLQQQAYIVERLDRFLRVQFAGIRVHISLVDRIAMKANIRVNQLNVQLETKTLDSVFVTVVAFTQFRVNPDDVTIICYELHGPTGQLGSYMEGALCSAIPAPTSDDAFARKDDVASDVQKTIGAGTSRFGFTMVKTLITVIDPSLQAKNAVDPINAARRERETTCQRAEAQHIQIEMQVTADAEKTCPQDEDQANYRREIANGIADQIKSSQAVGMDINDMGNMMLFNRYLDVMHSLSESKNTRTAVLPAFTPGGYQDLYEQVTKAMLTASEAE